MPAIAAHPPATADLPQHQFQFQPANETAAEHFLLDTFDPPPVALSGRQPSPCSAGPGALTAEIRPPGSAPRPVPEPYAFRPTPYGSAADCYYACKYSVASARLCSQLPGAKPSPTALSLLSNVRDQLARKHHGQFLLIVTLRVVQSHSRIPDVLDLAALRLPYINRLAVLPLTTSSLPPTACGPKSIPAPH